MIPTQGQVVFSKAGRDAGKAMVIIEVLDKHYVLISDGRLRRIEKPKRKKIKHLELTDKVIESISIKLKSSVRVSNSELRKALEIVEGQGELTENQSI